jgi:hypothetical protein
MNYINILAAVSLASVAVWLWRVSEIQEIELSLGTSLYPIRPVAAFPKPRAVDRWRQATVRRALQAFAHYFDVVVLAILLWLVSTTILIFYHMIIESSLTGLFLLAYLLMNTLLIGTVCFPIVALFSPEDSLLFRATGIDKQQWLVLLGIVRIEMMRGLEEDVVEYTGQATLPRKIYEDDSHSMSISLKPTFEIPSEGYEPFHVEDARTGKSIAIRIQRDSSLEQFLEIELLAAGLTVDGEKRQRQNLNGPVLSYRWNCYFPNSGNHMITLVIRLASESDTIQLGAIEHTIKVAKLDHLTKRQLWIVASLAGILSGGLAIAEALHGLGVW